MESIITAIIAGGLALIGTVITVSSGQKKTDIKTLDRFRHLAYTKQVVKNTMFLCCRKVH